MENAFPEKGTMDILRCSQPELSDPMFNETLMKKIVEERNKKIKTRLWINYCLITASVCLIIFLIGRTFLIAPPIVVEDNDQAVVGSVRSMIADYGYLILPLFVLVAFKKLLDYSAKRR